MSLPRQKNLNTLRPGQRVAVVGSGISGLATAWLLSARHDVHLFEAADYPGGHTHTVEVADDRGQRLDVDTGFIVFNPRNYPQLCGLLKSLGVASQASDMSFGVSMADGRVEFGGASLQQLFARPGSLVDPAHWSMITDILRFNRVAKRHLAEPTPGLESLQEFLDRERLGTAFRDRYLLPMTAAIWSTPAHRMRAYPATSLLRFMANHGLLDLYGRPGWRTVTGGSRRYVDRMLPGIRHLRLSTPVYTVRRRQGRPVLVLGNGDRFACDQVVLACHADQALNLLAEPSALERRYLGAFRYETNDAVLHTDADLMPKRRRVWSSWNYVAGDDAADTNKVSVTYWMNRLQRLTTTTDFFVTLNPGRDIAAAHIQGRYRYQHPLFDADAVRAQATLGQLQGHANTWFCGSYFGYGFHEDGLNSALAVADAFGIVAPWQRRPRTHTEARHGWHDAAVGGVS